ncbi:cupin domain-containing protein [Sphingomonas sp.]|uniref:cupin domain-containing protein n=1 Tax=Sphingomonas sp. TaxID=28214 RepID=UPI0025F0F82E|nr:cupin domain-containing protein [Sphingomonas sp.]
MTDIPQFRRDQAEVRETLPDSAVPAKQRRQLECTPGDTHTLGLPWVFQNQSGFNFWDVKTGDYFVQLEGRHYGWDSSTVQVSEMGPGQGPGMHMHPVEEIFVLVEGEVAFGLKEEVIHLRAPAIMRIPPNTPHNVTTLGQGRAKLVDFFPSAHPGGMPGGLPDPFDYLKKGQTSEKAAQIANFKKIVADFDDDGDGRISREEAPMMLRDMFGRYDSDHDGYISMEDAEAWN